MGRTISHDRGASLTRLFSITTIRQMIFFSAQGSQKQHVYRLCGRLPTLAAFSTRHTLGMPFVYPDNYLERYPGNFLYMLFRTLSEAKYRPKNPTFWKRALRRSHRFSSSTVTPITKQLLGTNTILGGPAASPRGDPYRGLSPLPPPIRRRALWSAARRRPKRRRACPCTC